jgi:hypothetical protein
LDSIRANNVDKTSVSCVQCKLEFPSKGDLEKHSTSCGFKENSILCDICGKSFTDFENLELHRSESHSEYMMLSESDVSNVLPTNMDIDFECKKCKFTFVNENELSKHECKRNNFGCSSCEDMFSDEISRDIHRNTHHDNEKVYQCDYCDLRISASGEVDALKHMQNHHEVCLCKPKTVIPISKYVNLVSLCLQTT